MPLEITCSGCGSVIYTGFDLKSAKDVIRANQNKCKSCGKGLSANDYTIDISKSQMSQ
ncbi:MAG TPA: hypothetical protein VJN71_07930 [Nitrososphaerales archaeon]|nr:hypothetical protein [Nitrososphaerales archaeon]